MIDWMAFIIVFVAALVSSSLLVALYSLGIRFLAIPAPVVDGTAQGGPARDDEDDDVEGQGRPRWATASAYLCFGLAGVGVLYGIYLIVPALHG